MASERAEAPPDLTDFRGSIATRLILFAILLASLTAALIGTLSYTRSRSALETEARARLVLTARDVAERMHRELEDRLAEVTNWAHLEVMRAILYHDVDKELAQFLEQMVRGRQLYLAIVCFDRGGQVVARAGEPLLLVAPDISRTRVSMVPLMPGSNRQALRLDSPIHNPEAPAPTIGTLVAVLDPRRLVDAIRPATGPATTRALLTVSQRGGDVILTAGARAAEGTMLHGSAAVGAPSTGDRPDLEVVVGEPATVALAAVTALRTTLIKVGALALLVSSALGALVAWHISSPIRELTATVRSIGASGRVEAPVEFPSAGGEIGVLARAFRAMMNSLAAAQAEALLQSRRAFLGEIAANVAHEIRTPLSVLKTSAQLLGRQELPAADQRKLAMNVAAEVDRLNRVVTSLVDLARPKPVRYRTESLTGVLEKAVTLLRPEADRLAVDISHDVADASLRVYASADQLHQVLLNVMQNALQAMAGPGVIRIRCHRLGDWGIVEISDTGPGFPEEMLAEAFTPFRTTKPVGTGLGLAISKRIVEEHGGAISAENAPGGGACLRIRLPARGEGT